MSHEEKKLDLRKMAIEEIVRLTGSNNMPSFNQILEKEKELASMPIIRMALNS